MADETKGTLTEEEVKTSLEALGVFVAEFDGKAYVKCNALERALYGYGRGENDNIVSLKAFTERLNNETDPSA